MNRLALCQGSLETLGHGVVVVPRRVVWGRSDLTREEVEACERFAIGTGMHFGSVLDAAVDILQRCP